FTIPGVPQPEAVGESQLAFTLFNKELMDHTRSNKLQLKATMQRINDSWSSQAPPEFRRVPDYPCRAMSLKLVWMPVKKQDKTALPVWDEQAPVLTAPSQPMTTWKRRVVVDSTHYTIPPGETFDLPNFPASRVVSLSAFYHFTMDANQAARFGSGFAAGDHAIL